MGARIVLNRQEMQRVVEWGPSIFERGSEEDAHDWLNTIRDGCEARSIPEYLYHVVARLYLGEELEAYVAKYERSPLGLSSAFRWNWEAFKAVIVRMAKDLPTLEKNEQKFEEQLEEKTEDGRKENVWDAMTKLIHEHPTASRALGGILIASGTACVLPAVAIGSLGLVGFSSGGVAAGSAAAGIQSVVYGGAVSSGSIFAMAQSAGATGVAVSTTAQCLWGTMAGASWFGLSSKRQPATSTDNTGLNPEASTELGKSTTSSRQIDDE